MTPTAIYQSKHNAAWEQQKYDKLVKPASDLLTSSVEQVIQAYRLLINRKEEVDAEMWFSALADLELDKEYVEVIGRNDVITRYYDQLPRSDDKVYAICILTSDPTKIWYTHTIKALDDKVIDRHSSLAQIRNIALEAFDGDPLMPWTEPTEPIKVETPQVASAPPEVPSFHKVTERSRTHRPDTPWTDDSHRWRWLNFYAQYCKQHTGFEVNSGHLLDAIRSLKA